MGQINTTNYPTVSSLADADLLIVENAVHGTGTTTPKQLRENAIGTDVLKTTAQTVTGAINEIWETGGGALRGSGKAVSVTNNIIDTDIDLGRAPQVGDRILVLFDSSVTSVNAIKTYNGSTAVQTPWENVPVLDFHLNGVCIIEFIANPLSPDPTAICARLVRMFEGTVYTAGTGIGIDNDTITNTKPQMGVNIDGGTINSVSSGNLGSYAKAAKYIVMTFNCNAVAYDGAYHLILSASGSVVVMYEAVLVDPVTGGRYTKDIKKYTTLVCEVTTTGAGTSADPILVNVIGEITNDLADKVDAVLDAISEEKTVSGNPITITDALPVPAKSLTATLNPIQDLHGYDHPWAGGAGKNKLPMTVAGIKAANTDGTWSGNVYTINGGTFEILVDNADNVIGFKANGTFTDVSIFNLSTYTANTGDILNGCPSGGSEGTYKVYARGGSTGDMGSGATVAAGDVGVERIYAIAVFAGTISNKMFYPMIRLSTESDATFAPYSNICPISGRTGTTVSTRNADNTETASATISFGQTVYGGQVDFKTGRVTVTKASVDMGSIEWTYDSSKAFFKYTMPSTFKNNSSLVCSIYPYKGQRNDGQMDTAEYGIYDVNTTIKVKDTRYTDATAYTTAVTGQTLCYELSTPTELTLTPAQLEMLKGYNRVTMDNGNISLTYKANRLDALMAALQNT